MTDIKRVTDKTKLAKNGNIHFLLSLKTLNPECELTCLFTLANGSLIQISFLYTFFIPKKMIKTFSFVQIKTRVDRNYQNFKPTRDFAAEFSELG